MNTTELIRIDHEDIRRNAEQLLVLYDRSYDGDSPEETYRSIHENYRLASYILKHAIKKFGLYFMLPIFRQVEARHRISHPETTIPQDAFGQLLTYDGFGQERQWGNTPAWQDAAAALRLPTRLATAIQSMGLQLTKNNLDQRCLDNLVGALAQPVHQEPELTLEDIGTQSVELQAALDQLQDLRS